MHAVYEYFSAASTVPGGHILSRHDTREQAEALAMAAKQAATRQYTEAAKTPQQIDAIIEREHPDTWEHRRTPWGGRELFDLRLRYGNRPQRAYEVYDLDDAEAVAMVQARARGQQPIPQELRAVS